MSLKHQTKKYIFLALLLIFCAYTALVAISEPLNPAEEISEEAQKGKLLFQEYNCISCHQIYGLGGYMGPDLTNVYSNSGEDIIKHFLKNGSRKMPDFFLNEEQITALTAYLEFIDKSGVYPVTDFEITPYGTVIVK
jgi:nitric oxide reductase subunit C